MRARYREAVTDGFAHLHVHTEYSMLDGASRLKDLVAAVARDGQPALAITDHGNMYGVLDFYKECTAAGVNPIIGTEAYMAAESRFERPTRRGKLDDTGGETGSGEKLYYHLTLLAETTQGYRNLIKLSSEAYLSGYYMKPKVDWELLERYHDGIIATTGCLSGLVNQALARGDVAGATRVAGRLQDIFGTENLFVELQDHGIALQHQTNPALIEIARRIGAPLLATNDSHYTRQEDAAAHDALLCVQTQSTIADPNRFKFEGVEHYVKTAAQMRSLFSEVPEACDNTLWIAERAHVEIEFGTARLPHFEVPGEFQVRTADGAVDSQASARAYLRHLTLEGARVRYGERLDDTVAKRIDYELGVIADMGFEAYFLIVWDLIRHARESGIRVGPGRGSAAGSCVAYCLGIVALDPIAHDLIFERFLNPGRKQMPDIDMDFDERYRGEMIRYCADKYGWDHVAQIITFSTIKARAAVRDAARVLALPYQVGDRIAKAMPPLVMGRDTPLYACLEKVEGYEDGYIAAAELREMYSSDPEVRKVVDVARGLEGLRRQDSIHAAAVVITDGPLTDYLPIQRKPESGSDPESAPIVTQFEMHGVEELGLLKMDFLGLRNLTVIERALDLIERREGRRPDIDAIERDDPKVYQMLQKGDSIGVFQLEGGPMRALMRSLAPTCFDDIAALVALYRPGPMAANMHNDYADRKNGRQPVTYPHPDLEPILADTYGLMIYQESMMRVAQKCAGYSLEEADNLRKAAGKKVREIMAAEREKFVAGCEATGYGRELGTQLFDIIEPFADYAFNKSHAYGYGLVAYQTAWLKANFPVEYMAAMLTSVKDDKDRTAIYLGECRSMGITVTVPDVNRSESDFAPDPGGEPLITFGLSAVRNVGEGVVELIVRERAANGPFTSFYDFCERVDPTVLNKRTVESLIKAGAFDSLGHPRKGLMASFEQICDSTLSRRREREQGIVSLFDSVGPVGGEEASPGLEVRIAIPDLEFERSELLAHEKEMLGLYVSSHPLAGLAHDLVRYRDLSVAEALEAGGADGSPGGLDLAGGQNGSNGSYSNGVRRLAGVMTAVSRRYTKQGKAMATFSLEDLEASIEVWVFPKTYEEIGHLLADDQVVSVRGRIDTRDDRPKLVAMEVTPLELTGEERPLEVVLAPHRLNDSTVEELKSVLSRHGGHLPVVLRVGERRWRLPPDYNVEPRSALFAELREMFGRDCLGS
jgi:DNA polymerase-3 subunit alpha